MTPETGSALRDRHPDRGRVPFFLGVTRPTDDTVSSRVSEGFYESGSPRAPTHLKGTPDVRLETDLTPGSTTERVDTFSRKLDV